MMAFRWCAFLVLCLLVTAATAADQYAVPPHPASDNQKKCAVAFDAGYPKTTGDANAWNIEVKLKYNYDTAWQFKELRVYYDRIDPGKKTTTQGPVHTVANERDIRTKGSYSVTFNDVTPPGGTEEIQVFAKITVKKDGEADRSITTFAKALPPP